MIEITLSDFLNKNEKLVRILVKSGIFNLTNASITFHLDSEGMIRKVEKNIVTSFKD